MKFIHLALTHEEAKEVREALLETKRPWSRSLDRITKDIQDKIDGKDN